MPNPDTAQQVPALDISGLTVRYGPVTALDDVSMTVRPGRICGMIGMNGSGKSTLFKSIMGLVRPTSGRVTIAGHSTSRARCIGGRDGLRKPLWIFARTRLASKAIGAA